MSKPSGGIRSLPSLSAWGLPTPVVALACIGNVGIQEFSCAGGRLYFVWRLQVCCYKPPLKGVEGFTREVYFLVQSCQNRPAEFARCPRCPPVACQRRWLPLPVLAMLIFKSFLVQVGDFISYGICKFICLSSFMYNRFHKELRFFFSLLKRKKEAKKEKSSHSTCTTRSNITRRLHERLRTRAIYSHRFLSTKLPRRGEQAAAAAVTLPFLHLKLGRKVSGDSPPPSQ